MRFTKWLPVALLGLTLFSAGCSNTPLATFGTVGYSHLEYPPGSATDSSQIRLSRVIWGPFWVRFLGTTGLGDQLRLQAVLYRNGEPVDWWPQHQNVQVHAGTWEIGINANDYGVPSELPVLEPGYALEVFEGSYALISTKFDLDLPGLPAGNIPTDNLTSELVDSRWALTSINGHSPVLFTHITLDFRGGSFGGSGGCNSYGGKYQTKAPNLINISSPISTQLGCWWQAITNQEETYLRTLHDAACYRIMGNRLELYDVVTNQRSLVFTRQREGTR